MKYQIDTFGDVTKHKCLVALTDEMNKLVEGEDPKERNKATYLAHLIAQYHSTLYKIHKARGKVTEIKPLLLRYVFDDFSNRVKVKELPYNLETHILCFLSGLYKGYLDKIRDGEV